MPCDSSYGLDYARRCMLLLCYCQDELVDSDGYRYTLNVDKRRPGITARRARRTSAMTSNATVHDRLGFYACGGQAHMCNTHPDMHIYHRTRRCNGWKAS